MNLLVPRYELIADFPGNTNRVGTIYSCPYKESYAQNKWCEYYDKFPYVFTKLNWHQYRKIEDMPEYVMEIKTGVVKKVFKHFKYIQVTAEGRVEYDANAVCSFDEVAKFNDYELLFWRYDLCLPICNMK